MAWLMDRQSEKTDMQVDYLQGKKNLITTMLAQEKIDGLIFTKTNKKLVAKHKHTWFKTGMSQAIASNIGTILHLITQN